MKKDVNDWLKSFVFIVLYALGFQACVSARVGAHRVEEPSRGNGQKTDGDFRMVWEGGGGGEFVLFDLREAGDEWLSIAEGDPNGESARVFLLDAVGVVNGQLRAHGVGIVNGRRDGMTVEVIETPRGDNSGTRPNSTRRVVLYFIHKGRIYSDLEVSIFSSDFIEQLNWGLKSARRGLEVQRAKTDKVSIRSSDGFALPDFPLPWKFDSASPVNADKEQKQKPRPIKEP